MSAEFVIDFYFHAFGIDLPELLHMKAPRGETVLNPNSRTSGHVSEMARRFPDARYAYHPELSRSNITGPIAWVYANPKPVGGAAVVLAPAVGIVAATSVYPTVAGPQYQSAMSGQMSIGSSALNMPHRDDWRDYFTWSYWSANR